MLTVSCGLSRLLIGDRDHLGKIEANRQLMHAYVSVPASLRVTNPLASFISHCGGGGLRSSGLVGTCVPGQPVYSLSQ